MLALAALCGQATSEEACGGADQGRRAKQNPTTTSNGSWYQSFYSNSNRKWRENQLAIFTSSTESVKLALRNG
jgi:hypothetical protein